jgi:tetratricopeptide (TPR) repeat protein
MRESIRLDPANASQAWNYLGYMWVDRDMNLEEAGELIKKAVDSDPDNAAISTASVGSTYKVGRYEEALREITKATRTCKEEDAGSLRPPCGRIYQKLNKAG